MTDSINFQELAAQIAAHLGGSVLEHADSGSDQRFTIVLPGIHPMAQISVAFDGWRNKGRLTARRRYPTTHQGNSGYPRFYLSADEIADLNVTSEITADYSRPVEKVAGDISRRLLKDFGVVLTKMDAARQALEDENVRKDAIFAEMCTLAGVTNHLDMPPHRRSDDRSFMAYRVGRHSIKCDVRYGGEVALEFSGLAPELAGQLIKLVRAASQTEE